MANQSAEGNYTVEAVLRIGARWIDREVFGKIIGDYLQSEAQRTGKMRRFYQRLLPPLVTMWLMVYQMLNSDHSLDQAVSAFVGQLPLEQAQRVSESSSAYSQARQRLPEAVIQASLKHTAQRLREAMGEAALWCGRQVALLDGSTLRLSASQPLHDHYGVSSNQHGENHWPLMRILAAFHLFSGGVEAAVEAPYTESESNMAVHLMREAGPDWVWVGDMNFGIYRIVQVAHASLQDVVVRVQPCRVKQWIAQHPIHSGEDRDVVWSGDRGGHVEDDLPAAAIAGRLIFLRVEHPGFRPIELYLFTTLTDRQRYTTQAILNLYGRRWNVELNLRHLKTTLQLEQLLGKSVDIVRKELWVGLLTYTLIRGLMGLAALKAHIAPLGLSFVRCARRIVSSAHHLVEAVTPEQHLAAWSALFERLAKCRLPVRKKARFEPRRVWGKPRVFPTIKGSRHNARIEELAKLAPAIS